MASGEREQRDRVMICFIEICSKLSPPGYTLIGFNSVYWLFSLPAWFAWLRSDEVSDLGHAFDVELMNRILQDAVSIGHALVLAQVLKP